MLHWILAWVSGIQPTDAHPITLISILILLPRLYLGLWNGLFPSGFVTTFLCISCPSYACHVLICLILLYLITLIMFGEVLHAFGKETKLPDYSGLQCKAWVMAIWTVGSWFWIPLKAQMYVCIFCVVVCGHGSCDSCLLSKESFQVLKEILKPDRKFARKANAHTGLQQFCCRIKIMKLFIIHFTPAFCYFLAVIFIYSFQYPLQKHSRL